MANKVISDFTATTSPADNDLMLIERAADGAYRKVTVSNFRSALDSLGELSDVSFTGLAANDLLKYNGTNWVNSAGLVASDIGDFDTEVSNNSDVSANTSARHSAVTVSDTASINLSLTGQLLSATLQQSAISIPASQISDFDTEVSNNTDVDANTTHRTSTGADHTYINQDVTTTASPSFAGLTVDTDTLYVDSTNNRVGIGTLTPDTLLEIVETRPILTIRDSDTSVTTAISKLRLAESGSSDSLGAYYDVVAGTGTGAFDFHIDYNGTPFLTIEATGGVGIGTSNPISNLDIYESGGSPDITIRRASQAWSSGVEHGGITWYTDDTSGIGAHNIGRIYLLETDSQTTPTPDMIFEVANTNTAADEKMRITGDGNVGIGTTSPATKLEIEDGTVTIDQNTDAIGLTIDSESTNFRAAEIYNAGTKQTLYLVQEGVLASANSGLQLYSNAAQTTGDALSRIWMDNAASTIPAQLITNDGTGFGLNIDQNGNSAAIFSDSVDTTANTNWFYNNAVKTGGSLLFVEMDNAASSANAAVIQNDGTGNGLFIDQNGNGVSLNIDSEATTSDIIYVDGSTLTTGKAIKVTAGDVLLPQNNDATTPTLAFGDGDTGIYEQADDQMIFAVAGAGRAYIAGNTLGGFNSNAYGLQNEAASSTNPTITPDRSDDNTGVGRAGADQLSLIAGGVEGARITTAGIAINANTTANRPVTGLQAGIMFFDTTLGIPIWYDGANWVNASGTTV